MRIKLFKTLIIAFFMFAMVFSVANITSRDLAAEIVYHEAYYHFGPGGIFLGVECKGSGKTCKIEIIGNVPYLREVG